MDLAMLGVGPQRTGTTWLWECLRVHPDLCFPRGVKETTYFDERFHEGWAWYRSHFAHRRAHQRCAEIGATYFDGLEVPVRVKRHAPGCRIVVTLRDPAARTFSLYLHHRRKSRVMGDFARALREMPRLLESSRYRAHLARWREVFGPERVLILLLDDIARAPARELARVRECLGLRDVPVPPEAFRRVNAGSLPAHAGLARLVTAAADRLREQRLYAPIELARRLGLKRVYGGAPAGVPAMDPRTRRLLVREFEADIAYVEQVLGRPLPQWRMEAGP